MRMRYRGIIRLVPVCAIWLALAVIALAIIETPAEPLAIAVSSIICLLVLLLAFRLSTEIFFKAIKLNKQRIEFTQSLTKPCSYSWSQLETVNFLNRWQAFELKFEDGRRVKVSLMMDNLKSFLQLLSEQLPRDKYIDAINQFAGSYGGKDD
ncbi:hypothetical protein [Idiomarina seosinensis]|uniref:YcxB-like protein domain-containing protein n=1 Tax=Idiomarina seosinensis TaxID=281739 RepID=A0A432ZH57_9GAMM|nr:hypothetical protein [Idiomarina seosinensis]RUO77301.1 hypothetical protein CWI81_02095 [Idiomarina seosinensis]